MKAHQNRHHFNFSHQIPRDYLVLQSPVEINSLEHFDKIPFAVRYFCNTRKKPNITRKTAV